MTEAPHEQIALTAKGEAYAEAHNVMRFPVPLPDAPREVGFPDPHATAKAMLLSCLPDKQAASIDPSANHSSVEAFMTLLSAAAQNLIDLIDDLGGEPDLEDGGDDEPSIGTGYGCEREADPAEYDCDEIIRGGGYHV